MIKILHISSDSNLGGAGHQLLALIDAIDTSLFHMEVVLPEGARLSKSLAKRGVKFTEVPHIAERSFSLAGVRELSKAIKACKPDIVHTHGSLSGRIAARLSRRCKIVQTRHSVFTLASWRKRFPARFLSGLINNFFSDLSIAVSPAAKDNLLEMGTKESKIRVVFNGLAPVEVRGQRLEIRKKHNIPTDAFVLVMLARLTEVKGHDDVLDAAKLLPEGILILAAGDGPRQKHLEERISSEGITNVRLLGWVDEVEEIISIADAGLIASFGTEATSLSLIQGMSAGLPGVVTDFGGNPYVILDGVNGLVTPTRDPKALADAIIKLQSDPELYEKLSKGALRVYEEKFTEKKMASDTEDVYKELTKGDIS